MSQYLVYAIVAGIVIFVIWISIKTAVREAREAGAAEQRAGDQVDARKAEQEMTDIVLTPREPGETEKRLDDGTF